MSPAHDTTFRSMGSDVRLIVEAPLLPGLPAPAQAAEGERRYIEDFARRLSRFRPDSELCALNADRSGEAPASILLRTAVAAGLWAAERSGGLVDPTLRRRDRGGRIRELPGRQHARAPAARPRRGTAAPAGAAQSPGALAPGRGRPRARHRATATGTADRHRWNRQGPRRRRRRSPPARVHPLRGRLRRRHRRRRGRRPARSDRDRGGAPAHRRVRPHAADRARRQWPPPA